MTRMIFIVAAAVLCGAPSPPANANLNSPEPARADVSLLARDVLLPQADWMMP